MSTPASPCQLTPVRLTKYGLCVNMLLYGGTGQGVRNTDHYQTGGASGNIATPRQSEDKRIWQKRLAKML